MPIGVGDGHRRGLEFPYAPQRSSIRRSFQIETDPAHMTGKSAATK
ncbi:MAG TPA: hypothetical protein VN615_17290 [Gaiellales bacterium]|nr:hypothetical protein [Gaiellales bacterium]